MTKSNLATAMPCNAGIGLRAPHYREILETLPDIGWLEVHSENYFGAGGQPLYFLERIAAHYPLSFHGVGLSLGSVNPLNFEHLVKLKKLIDRFQPRLVSEHLCWGAIGDRHLNDLLPMPYVEEALTHLSNRIQQTQEVLGRRILIENVSSYLQFTDSNIPEWEFVAELVRLAGCGLLLDVNNIYVNSVNHGFDPISYLDAIPQGAVEEIHLAGFDSNGECLIDTHGKSVSEPVWVLYQQAIQRFGNQPTLIEWDTDIPPLATLLGEAAHANALLTGNMAVRA